MVGFRQLGVRVCFPKTGLRVILFHSKDDFHLTVSKS